MTKAKIKRLAVLDLETDPFLYGRPPEAFAAGFFDGETYKDFWGSRCVHELCAYLETREPLMIYAHNGGKFDFFYMIEAEVVNNPLSLINGRIVKLGLGHHELRDSFAIIPVALAQAGGKLKIDYEKFEASVREKHRPEILHYLATDCEELYKVVAAFHARFGPMLTVGSTAIKELGKLHPIRRGNAEHDELFRPFYYGGRVSTFEPGVHRGDFKAYDVNSMYSHVMRNFPHPYGSKYLTLDNPSLNAWGDVEGYEKRPYFAHIIATNRAALPIRTKAGLSFDQTDGEFFACGHEIRVAVKLGLLDVHAVKRAYVPLTLIRFTAFVDTWSTEKRAGKAEGDKTRELFAKFMLNSSYGKFGQNPAHYYDYHIKRFDEKIPSSEWEMHLDYGAWEIWRKPSPKPRYFDVAIAASVTSGARSVLLEAIAASLRPAYCDTDGLICVALKGVPLDDSALGAWKLEARGSLLAIAGKKMYALFDGSTSVKPCDSTCDYRFPCKRCGCVKMASKGADLEPADILALAQGETRVWRKEAPTFKLGRPINPRGPEARAAMFLTRRITPTVPVLPQNKGVQLPLDNPKRGL